MGRRATDELLFSGAPGLGQSANRRGTAQKVSHEPGIQGPRFAGGRGPPALG